MADEVNEKESPPELSPGEESPPEVEAVVSQGEVPELHSEQAQEDEDQVEAEGRRVELEEVVAARDSGIATLKEAQAELEGKVSTLGSALAEAVASYKAMVLQAHPEVIEELVSGDNIEAIDESLNKARTLVSKMRQGLEAEISSAKVPAGAPERTSPDLSALSPREKIEYAIGRMR